MVLCTKLKLFLVVLSVVPRPPAGLPENTVHVKFELSKINEFQFKLAKIIEMCQRRIDWLMEGSKKVGSWNILKY